LTGLITNGTGGKLRNVYVAYRGGDFDTLLYKPSWDPGTSLDLVKDFQMPPAKGVDAAGRATGMLSIPERGDTLRGDIRATDVGWTAYWYEPFRKSNFNETVRSDWGERVMRSFPMLSLFDRLPPMQNPRDTQNRVELLRLGARWMDVSAAVAAGQLVVLAESETADVPLPIPLEVEGDRVAGRGKIFYQFVLPLDRSNVTAADDATGDGSATQPAAPPAAPKGPVEQET
jgi:hypothetical protein